MERKAPQLSASSGEHFDPGAPTLSLGNVPVPTRQASPVVALSEDPMLVQAISSAALDQAELIVSPCADRFIDQLVATGAELALIDTAAAPPGLAEFLVSLHRQFPHLQLLLAGPGNVQHQIATQITDGTVFRFAHKPASAQRLKLFIEAALRQRQARITEQILGTPVSAQQAANTPQSPFGRRRWMTGSSIALLVAGSAAALLWHFSSTARSLRTDAVALPPIQAAAAVPNAVDSRSPIPAATLTLQREAEQEAIDRAAAQRAGSDHIAAEEQMRVAATAEQARRASAAAAQALADQIHLYVQLAHSRIESGALIEPSDDSARSYLNSALALAPDDASVLAVSQTLGAALIESFRKALAAGDSASAQRWLTASRNNAVGETTLIQMSVQLGAFESARVARLAAEQAMATMDTTTDTTTPEEAPIMPEASLQRLVFVPPTYPPDALLRGQTGSVELDFTVSPEGMVADVNVTAASPVGVFEDAAIDALSRARYQPVLRDGVPVAQRAHIRVRFAL